MKSRPSILAGLLFAAIGPALADTPMPAHPPSVISLAPPVIGNEPARRSPAQATPAAAPASAAPLLPAAPDLRADRDPAKDADRSPEPRAEHIVVEDSSVRIEEERVRSQTTKIVVKSKVPGMGSYEIAPADLSKDPSADTKAGKRIWFNIGF